MYKIQYRIRIGQPCGESKTRLFVWFSGPLWLIITVSHYTATYADNSPPSILIFAHRQTWEIVPLSMAPVAWQMGSVYYENPINASHSTPDLIPVFFAWMTLAILIFLYTLRSIDFDKRAARQGNGLDENYAQLLVRCKPARMA